MAAAGHLPRRRLVLGVGSRAAGMGARRRGTQRSLGADDVYPPRPSWIMPIPVTPMLPGIAQPVAPDLPHGRFGLDPSKFLFLFLFDMNSVMERKNPLATVAAFRRLSAVRKTFNSPSKCRAATPIRRVLPACGGL